MSATSSSALRFPVSYPVDFNVRRTASVHRLLPFRAQALADRSASAKTPFIHELHRRLDLIEKLSANWDGHGSLPPDVTAVANARQILEDLYRQTEESIARAQDDTPAYWQRPHTSASEDGEIVFEWWNGERKLTIYVGRDQPTYIKSWGPDVVDQMEDGVLSDDDVPMLWTWLFE